MYTPRGEKLERGLTKEEVLSLLDCIKVLRENNIIHRDLGPNNLIKSNGKIVLIDFGTAIFFNFNGKNDSICHDKKEIRRSYQGSVEFAAAHILEHLVDTEKQVESKNTQKTSNTRTSRKRKQRSNE